MLIAGTTGSGKSNSFKQVLFGLLESTPYLQMYLCDLKNGLEMVDFAKAPNVQMVKTMKDAVKVMEKIEAEMMDRFRLLERVGDKQIVPKKHKRDRILFVVDEASVLYQKRSRADAEYQLAMRARTLLDKIAKLSRASAIHVLLATQKLDREVLPTSVSENLSGRLAFRTNSLQGSLAVLGSKAAMELPDLPGRGIWALGNKEEVFQTLFTEDSLIRERCAEIALAFEENQKELLQPMLSSNAEKSGGHTNENIAQKITQRAKPIE